MTKRKSNKILKRMRVMKRLNENFMEHLSEETKRADFADRKM
jgi:hypothetical protein